jgi:hypothetical protein
MKHVKVGISVFVFLLAIGASFAFRAPKAATTYVWFDFIGNPGEEFDPAKYVAAVGTPGCSGQGGPLCAAACDPAEIYTSGTYAGLPMVDDWNTGIANVVNYALISEEDNYQVEDFNAIAELKAP